MDQKLSTGEIICNRCGSSLEIVTIDSGSIYKGVRCDKCSNIECLSCKGLPPDRPCSWCGSKVSPVGDVNKSISTEVKHSVKCPYCAKEIDENAFACRHCGRAIMSTNQIKQVSETEKHYDQPNIFGDKFRGLSINGKLLAPNKVYYPGDVVKITIEINCKKRIKIDGIYAKLLLKETYLYAPIARSTSLFGYQERNETCSLFSSEKNLMGKGELPAGFHQVYDIDFPIAEDVSPTHNGKFSDINLEVNVRVPPVIATVRSKEIKLVVPPPGIYVTPIEEVNSNSQFEMRLRLPRLEWSEGEVIKGQLLVRPLVSNMKPTSAKVNIAVDETIPETENSYRKYSITEIETVKLANNALLPDGEFTKYDFEFLLPRQNRPTVKTNHIITRWVISASVWKGMMIPLKCGKYIFVYTALPRSKSMPQSDLVEPENTLPDSEPVLGLMVAQSYEKNATHIVSTEDEGYAGENKVDFAQTRLDAIVQKYISRGYKLVSKSEKSATLKRQSPVNIVVLIGLVVIFWIGAIIYLLARKKYQVTLNEQPDGSITETGGTLDEFDQDQERKSKRPKLGWFLIFTGGGIAITGGLFGLLFLLSSFSDPTLSEDVGSIFTSFFVCPMPVIVVGLLLLGGGIYKMNHADKKSSTTQAVLTQSLESSFGEPQKSSPSSTTAISKQSSNKQQAKDKKPSRSKTTSDATHALLTPPPASLPSEPKESKPSSTTAINQQSSNKQQAKGKKPSHSKATSGSKEVLEMNTVESSIASLVNDDHNVRKEAIKLLSSSGYQDPEEPRTIQILKKFSATDRNSLEIDLQQFPDFDVTYIRAGYPTMNSEDHANANIAFLIDGVIKCKRKGYLLARLSSYYMWKEDWLKALDFATSAVLVGDPSVGPGDMVQTTQLLMLAYRNLELLEDYIYLTTVQASYELSPEVTDIVNKAVAALVSQYKGEISWSADMIRKKTTDMHKKLFKKKFLSS